MDMETLEALKALKASSDSQSNRRTLENEGSNVVMDVDNAMDVIDDIPRLAVEGFDDDKEEVLIMSVEEAKEYILKQVLEYAKDSKVNPLLAHQKKIQEYYQQIQQKNEELNKLSKVFEVLYRDQVKFLRHIGVMPKANTKTVGVGVDLPWTNESIGGVELKRETGPVDAGFKNEPQTKSVKKNSSGNVECIDLSSDEDVPSTKPSSKASSSTSPVLQDSAHVPPTKIVESRPNKIAHPAPPPPAPMYLGHPANVPLKPKLRISVESKGIVLQWSMPPEATLLPSNVKKYEIFGYQEKPFIPPSSSLWKKIGTVDSMKLPMSCTLTQFVEGYNYHFSIRAVGPPDISGPFSEPATVKFNSI